MNRSENKNSENYKTHNSEDQMNKNDKTIESNVADPHDYHVHVEIPTPDVETFGNQTVTMISKPKKNKNFLPIIIGLVVVLLIVTIVFVF